MKKIFAFAIALVSMAAVMTSCNNDDNDYIMQPAPAAQQESAKDVEATVNFMLPVTDVQLEMMDIEIRYTIGGKTYTVTTDEMEKGSLDNPTEDLRGVGNSMLLTYSVPATFTVEELKDATVEYSIERKEEGVAKYQDQLIHVYEGFVCKVKTKYGDQIVGGYSFLGEVNISDPHNADHLFDNIQLMGTKTNIIRH